jgi:hypothetical protein
MVQCIVGENTIPNAMSFMSGYSFRDLQQTCFFSDDTPQDGCPHIWKRFHQANYVTSIVEDAPLLAIFHYLKTGFGMSNFKGLQAEEGTLLMYGFFSLVQRPVDFFFRPFMLGVHTHTPTAVSIHWICSR